MQEDQGEARSLVGIGEFDAVHGRRGHGQYLRLLGP